MPTSNSSSELPYGSSSAANPTMPHWDSYNPEYDLLHDDALLNQDGDRVLFEIPGTEAPFGDPKAVFGGLQPSQLPQAPIRSPPPHRGSSSSLSSSSRTSSEANRNGLSPETDLNFVDFKGSASTTFGGGASDIDLPPGTQWNPQGEDSMLDIFDFDSASSSPSPSLPGGQSEPTPAKKHKSSHNRLSKPTPRQGLKMAPRENSPTSVLTASQTVSPPAFARSPSTDNGFNSSMSNLNMSNAATGGWAQMGFHTPVPPRPTDPSGLAIRSHGLPNTHFQPSLHQGAHPTPRLVVTSTPVKSRVETQIPIKLTIHHLPRGIRRLHLPIHTISKPKLLAKTNSGCHSDMLELQTQLVCTSAMRDEAKRKRALARAAAAPYNAVKPKMDHGNSGDENEKPQNGGEVRICTGCITRERKRAGRKKHKKPEEEQLWDNYERERAIVFNTQEIKDWTQVTTQMADPTGSGVPGSITEGTFMVDCPMRIACYCRHHQEKVGFQVIFTIKDHQGNLVAQEMSSSIMITDDHKTLENNQKPTAPGNIPKPLGQPQSSLGNDTNMMEAPPLAPPPPTNYASGQPAPDLANSTTNLTYGFTATAVAASQPPSVTPTPLNLSPQGSPPSLPQSSARKRKHSENLPKVPNTLAMTKIDDSAQAPSLPATQNEQLDSGAASSSTPPYMPQPPDMHPSTESLFAHGQQPSGLVNIQQPFPTNTPTTPNGDYMYFTNRNGSLDNSNNHAMFPTSATTASSRAQSPNLLGADIQNMQSTQAAIGAFTSPTASAANRPPWIYKAIPSEGPKSGGIEVTILGNFFRRGLEVMFGDQKAATTTYWGDTSLVCLLPPSPMACTVPVSIIDPAGQASPAPTSFSQVLFRYKNDDEELLIRNALTVLGTKMNGGQNIGDAANFSRVILNVANGGSASSDWLSPGPQGQGSNTFNNMNAEVDVETSLIRVLEMIDYDDSGNRTRINRKTSNGQTMLHLACSAGFTRFVAGLLSRGANVHIEDSNGFTPLHMAAMNGRPEIVRRLLLKGADPECRTRLQLSASDLARSQDVIDSLKTVPSHPRSRSRGSRHSRAGSASSLRSLWEPPSNTQPQTREGFSDDSEESGDFSSSAEDSSGEEDLWLAKRRGSQAPPHIPRSAVPDLPTAIDRPPPTIAAVSAVRDQLAAQFQQAQQTMNMHLQALSFQMPNMPSGFPDYQSYLPQRPAMPRMTSLLPNMPNMPNMRSPRPEDRGQPVPDNRWSFFGSKEAPPPAYEDVFPQKDFDAKQASAAQAAVDFEADTKCGVLFDQTETATAATTSEDVERTQQNEIPPLLHVGRKKAITREQQEAFQRAHAASLKSVQSDKMLWFVWIPFLILILGAMLINCVPSIATTAMGAFEYVVGFLPTPDREASALENGALVT